MEKNPKIVAQEKYCEENKVPFFAPRKEICWSCGRDVYSGLSYEYCRNNLITGCPHCHRSFVD